MKNNGGEDGVGYKCPPKSTRFRKGQSGNRNGRPVGSKGQKSVINEVAYEMHDVVDAGVAKRLSTIEMVLLSIRNQALQGNTRAVRAFYDLIAKYNVENLNQRTGFLIIPESCKTDEEMEEQLAQHQKKWREK